MKKIIILGAGITGLSTAWKLSERNFDITIIEKDNTVGGLAKTIKFNNNYVDIGPHSFFSEDEEIYKTVRSLFNDDAENFIKVKRSVKMFFMNYYVDYPLSAKSILFQMGPIIPILSCFSFLKSLIKSFFIKKKISDKRLNVKKWAIENFGYFLYKNFFKPYTEQFWKIKTEELSHNVIPASKKLDFAKTLKHLFLSKYLEISKREPGSLNLVQRESLPTFYPKKGFGEISKKIEEIVLKNKCIINKNENIEKIIFNKNKCEYNIYTNKRDYVCDVLISTIPINYLVKNFDPVNKNKNVLDASKNLNYLALTILYLVVKKKNILNCQYCYFVGKPYNRIAELNLFSHEVSSKETTVLSIEISCHQNSEIWNSSENSIFDMCVENMEKDKILNKTDIVDWKIVKVPNVYPIYKINYEKDLKIIQNELRRYKNFYSIGRIGEFYYGDIDQMIKIGFDTAKKIAN